MDDMFGRLQVLLNGLEALGYTFPKAWINLKIPYNFPKGVGTKNNNYPRN